MKVRIFHGLPIFMETLATVNEIKAAVKDEIIALTEKLINEDKAGVVTAQTILAAIKAYEA
jgi:hypothetical protein